MGPKIAINLGKKKLNLQLHFVYFKESLEQLTFAGHLFFLSPEADTLTSSGQDSEPDEALSSADLSVQQCSSLPPTRLMINPTMSMYLVSSLQTICLFIVL